MKKENNQTNYVDQEDDWEDEDGIRLNELINDLKLSDDE